MTKRIHNINKQISIPIIIGILFLFNTHISKSIEFSNNSASIRFKDNTAFKISNGYLENKNTGNLVIECNSIIVVDKDVKNDANIIFNSCSIGNESHIICKRDYINNGKTIINLFSTLIVHRNLINTNYIFNQFMIEIGN